MLSTHSPFTAADERFMHEALALAKRGLYSTTPNPRVGCVITQNNQIVGSGWHQRAGEAHAEVLALKDAGANAKGATAYVTLEPCSHTGRTPPCVKALITAGIARVICAMEDPNPLVSGRGLRALAEAGIKTQSGLHEDAARELNLGFISRMTRGRPWLRVKIAASLDGKTALNNGESQWITGAAARQDGHDFRARACAILTGSGTVRADNPALTVRGVETERQPLKIIVDSALAISLDAQILQSGSVLIVTAINAEKQQREKLHQLKARGVEIISLPNQVGKVDLPALLIELGRREINEIHVEAGARLNGALLNAALVDELLLYLAPCVIGDKARSLFDLPELTSLNEKHRFAIHDAQKIGADLRIRVRADYA